MSRITFGMIVFESDFVLRECLEQVYPIAHQILIAEGPVKYWQERGRTTSEDNTNEILHSFPDPDKKIKIIHGAYTEKDQQCKAYMDHIDPNTEYLCNLDADEIYKTKDLNIISDFLSQENPTSVGMHSCTFYGGLDRYLTGFEQNVDNFLRIFKYIPNSTWLTHRPPTMQYPISVTKKHVSSVEMLLQTGVQMYHYSYVFPDQVYKKISYYKDRVSKDRCIDNYFSNIYMPWMCNNPENRYELERRFIGVHEFKPEFRGPCYTAPFHDTHPQSIKNNKVNILNKISEQLEKYKGDHNA